MAKNKSKIDRQHIKVDPAVYIPPGVKDLSYVEVVDDEREGSGSSDTGGLPVPDIFIIEAQRVRVQSSGAHVVDVAIITNDFPGVSEIEFRVTKETT